MTSRSERQAPLDPHPDDPASPPADLRLAGPAVATWLGAFLGTGWSLTRLAVGSLAVLAVLAGGLLAWRLRRASSGCTAPPCGLAVVRAGMAMLVCGLGGLLVGTLHQQEVVAGPVDELALARATFTGEATVTGDPRPARSVVPRDGPAVRSLVVPLRLDRVSARGRHARVRAPVIGFAHHRSWSGLLPGQQVQVTGRLAPAEQSRSVAAVVSLEGPARPAAAPARVERAAGAMRSGLRRASQVLGDEEEGLLPGLVVGDTTGQSPGLAEDFRTAGLTHLTAVSGANLAIVTGFVLLVGRQAGLRGRWLPVAAAVAMVGFVVLARPQPSVLRAAAMGAVALAALASGRRRRSLAALGAAVVVLLLVDPWLARTYGFVLSVLATAGLVVLAPAWARRWQERGVPLPVAHAVAVPLAAQLVCAPVVVMISDEVSLVAVPANLAAAPAVAPATVLGVLATVASVVHEPTAELLVRMAGTFVWWIVHVAHHAADAPLAAVAWPGSTPGALLLAGVSVGAVLVIRRLARRPWALVAAAGLVTVGLLVPATGPGWPPPDWLLAACDVGQGDALVLPVGAGSGVVVDTGPDPEAVDRCLRDLGIERVPLVLLTHLHADHVEGMPGVLRGRDVGEVQVGLHDEPVQEMARVRRWTRAADAALTRAAVGDRVRFGPLRWRVVAPDRVIQAGSVPNNASTVVLVRIRGVRLLLTGDVEPEGQRALLRSADVGAVDVLKVAHHGSAYQEPALLAAVRPRVALVSVGAGNDYGHPAPDTLAALEGAGALVGRTDRDGTLVVAGTPRSLRLVTRRR